MAQGRAGGLFALAGDVGHRYLAGGRQQYHGDDGDRRDRQRREAPRQDPAVAPAALLLVAGRVTLGIGHGRRQQQRPWRGSCGACSAPR